MDKFKRDTSSEVLMGGGSNYKTSKPLSTTGFM